jgi:glycosyltransferase involved in cell wall biosynthesis
MRILMVAQFYPPLSGGIERHVQNLSKALVDRGHHVAVATLWHPGLCDYEDTDGITVYRIHGSMQRIGKLFTSQRHHSPPFPDPETTLALWKIVIRERPDIVHVHDWMGRSYLPVKPISHAKFVRTLHDCELTCAQMRFTYMDTELCPGPRLQRCLRCTRNHYGGLKGPITLISNWVFGKLEKQAVDAYIPVSHAVQQANGLVESAASVQVIPNFIPDNLAAEQADKQDERLAQLPSEPYILQVGDLVQDKGIEVLLKAYALLQADSPVQPVPPLVLIGRSVERSPHIPPSITVIPNLPHALVMEAWRRCLFGTVASTCLDASPTVTLEAMSCNRPVIGSRIGGIADQIEEGVSGLLVPPGDAEALKIAMARLVCEPDLRESLARAASRRVVDFQACQVVNRIEALYQQHRIGGI